MRRNTTGPITSEMYRHFATVTVALTALVAFFANGESHKATASASQSHRAQPAPAPKQQFEIPQDRDAGRDSGSFGSDDNDGFGQPMVEAGGGGSWLPNPFVLSAGRPKPIVEDPSMPHDEAGGPGAEEPSAAGQPNAGQIAAVAAASRMRSGSGTGD